MENNFKIVNMARYNFLDKQLDLDLDPETYEKYNTEINQIQEDINYNKWLKTKLDNLKAIQLQTRIQELYKEGRMVQLVEEFGNEFKDDYHVDTTKLTIRSYAKNPRNPNQTNFWEHTSLEECLKHFHFLLYWRVYETYIRNINQVESYKVG